MELRYESTIEDVSEAHIRFYLRSRSYARQRWIEPLWGGIGAVVGFHLVSLFTQRLPSVWWFYAIVFLLGWFCLLITIRDTVSKRIRKHVERQTGHKLPSTTVYSIKDSRLHCSSLGAEITLHLRDLSAVHEDSERVELVFGDAGLCTIPLRAFEGKDHKASFLKSLEREDVPVQG